LSHPGPWWCQNNLFKQECIPYLGLYNAHWCIMRTPLLALLKMKRDKWFLNSPSKWNMLKGLKNIYDWYLILTFPTVIFLKAHAHYRHKLFFFWRFSRPRGGCAIYNPKYGTSIAIIKFKRSHMDWKQIKIALGNVRIKYQSYIFFSPLSMFHLLGEFKNHLSLSIFNKVAKY
jgi:hypothetical protein